MLQREKSLSPVKRYIYFLPQRVASAFFLYRILCLNFFVRGQLAPTLIVLALLVKLGVAPFHIWFIKLRASCGWSILLLLFTLQKLLPYYLLLQLQFAGLLWVILVNAALRAFSMLKEMRVKLVLGYSSLFNISWMLGRQRISVGLVYWCCYSIPVFLLGVSISEQEIKQDCFLSRQKNSISLILVVSCLLSLSGIPPYWGFFPKLLILQELLGVRFLVGVYLVGIRVLVLFVYFHLFASTFLSEMSLALPQMLKFWVRESGIVLLFFSGWLLNRIFHIGVEA